MLYRKIEKRIEEYFTSDTNKILIIDGARQVGKSYIIRHIGKKFFPNYIEINLLEDSINNKYFSNIRSINDFYLQVSMLAGDKLKDKNNTLIFLDEIQVYPELLTLLKFLNQDNKYTFIASGSLLGVTLSKTTSIPIGSIEVVHMYPLDFEEFLYANGFNEFSISLIKNKYEKYESLDNSTHLRLLDLFKKYLLVGGLPDAINQYLDNYNITNIRHIHSEIHEYYAMDASKYDSINRLKIRRIYDLIPSVLENKKKRIVIKDIENIKGKRASHYQDEFDYLINSGIVIDVKAISNPQFPLLETASKNLIKMYLNDIGILTNILYSNNIRAVLDDVKSINLGTVYESVVAQELKAHNKKLFYYDNRHKGEVDFLIDDFNNLSILPIEVKSGKDYTVHSALNKLLNDGTYNINKGYVLSNEREVIVKDKIIYLPIYYVMFI